MRASGERVAMEGWQSIEFLLVRLSFNLLVLVAEQRRISSPVTRS